MKPSTQRSVLTALCVVALVYIGGMILGIIGLARSQGVFFGLNIPAAHDRVSVVAAAFELSMFLGAALIPLVACLRLPGKIGNGLRYLWVPCILYVVAIGINFIVRNPNGIFSSLAGTGRLFAWLAIAALFICVSRKSEAAS